MIYIKNKQEDDGGCCDEGFIFILHYIYIWQHQQTHTIMHIQQQTFFF